MIDIFDFKFWQEQANLITLCITVVALFVAYRQLLVGRKESRRATAYTAYHSYLSMCFDYPILAHGVRNKIINDEELYTQYKWFVANMLFSFEQILDVSKGDDEWRKTIQHQLKRHIWHLQESGSVERRDWNKPLQDLIKKVCLLWPS